MPRINPLVIDKADDGISAAFDDHKRRFNAQITNMKATLALAPPAFHAYMQWYPLYEAVKKITGERLAYLLAYSISFAADCPLCSTFFRKIIIDNGEKPEDFKVNEKEQDLLSFGIAIAGNKGIITDDQVEKLKESYSDEELVLLIAFAGQMIATNIFNNVIETDIDDYLKDYLPVNKSNKL